MPDEIFDACFGLQQLKDIFESLPFQMKFTLVIFDILLYFQEDKLIENCRLPLEGVQSEGWVER